MWPSKLDEIGETGAVEAQSLECPGELRLDGAHHRLHLRRRDGVRLRQGVGDRSPLRLA
jgi:hypothetical protein